MKKIKFEILALAMIAFSFCVGSFYVHSDKGDPKSKTEISVISQTPQVAQLQKKEGYKLDNAEYKSAVATKSSFSGGNTAMYVMIGAVMLGIVLFLRKLFKQFRGMSFTKALTYSIFAALFAFTIFFPAEGIATMAMAAPALTPEEEERQKALLDKIEKQVKGIMSDATKENVTETALNKRIEKLNEDIKKLNDDSMKDLKERVDALAKSNTELQAELGESVKALKTQSEEIKKLKDLGLEKPTDDNRHTSFRKALKDAIMEANTGGTFLKEVNDDNGKRLSMKSYFEQGGNRKSPTMTIKAAVDMLESNIVQSNVSALRLTQLDPQRVGIPLVIYQHVMDIFSVKSITRPNMALLVVYSYEDGSVTKTEGAASNQSSFLFKTVSFPAFYIATYFTLSDETLDDLNEALDEISIVAPDKILSKIDSKIIATTGDDVTDIKGILTTGSTGKSTLFSSPVDKVIEDAYIVDVIAAAKLQCENNRYRPNAVILNPRDIVLLGAKKNDFADSQNDRRVVYNIIGEATSVCGLRIIANTDMPSNKMLVFDNMQPWIGRRQDMTMEIGYNGTDLTEGQKTVIIKIRLAFGVRDKAGVIYVSDIAAAIAALETS